MNITKKIYGNIGEEITKDDNTTSVRNLSSEEIKEIKENTIKQLKQTIIGLQQTINNLEVYPPRKGVLR